MTRELNAIIFGVLISSVVFGVPAFINGFHTGYARAMKEAGEQGYATKCPGHTRWRWKCEEERK
jgi:hypothetical protein